MKKNKVDNYLFLGLPKSGKTTYFSLMAHHLQQEANKSTRIKFSYSVSEENDVADSSDFINDCIQRIKKQEWPAKTMESDSGYAFELATFPRLFGSSRKSILEYRDYSGEAFEAAFGIPKENTEQTEHDAADMRERIKTALGIFLVLDADKIFNGINKNESRKNLERLFKFVRDTNPQIKLAVIFNKLELFPSKDNETIDFENMFRNEYGNAYSYLSFLKYRFFCVYPLGEVETDENGNVVPPKELSPRNDLEPIRWMLFPKSEHLSEHNDSVPHKTIGEQMVVGVDSAAKGVFGVAKGCSLVFIFLFITPILLLVALFSPDLGWKEAICASVAIVVIIGYIFYKPSSKNKP